MIKFFNFIVNYYFVISFILFSLFYTALLYINKEDFFKKQYSLFTPVLSSFVFSFVLVFNVGLLVFIFNEYVLR